jgi:tetratricopeptide (TPR) repeat protein
MRQGDAVNAALLYHATLAHDPGWVEAHLQLGLLYEDLGLMELAAEQLRAAGMPPDQINARRSHFQTLRSQYPDSARPALDTLSMDRIAGLASRFNQLGKHNTAYRLLDTALPRDTTHRRARFEHAFAIESLGRYRSALYAYQELERMAPEDPMIPYRIAWCYDGIGDEGTARASLRRAEKKARQLSDKEERERWLLLIADAYSLLDNFGPANPPSP